MNIKIVEQFKNIRKNAINFISIAAFIFLGTSLFQGLNYAGHAIQGTIDKTYKSMNSYDVKLRIGGLASQEDLNKISTVDGVDDIEGFYTSYDDFVLNDEMYNCSVESITERISTLYVWEGKLPSNDNEIAILKKCAEEFDFHIGDQITFKRENPSYFIQTIARDYTTTDMSEVVEDNLTNFKNDTFTITGLVGQTDHLNHNYAAHGIDMMNGTVIKANFYVNYSAFNPYMTGGRFNSAYVIDNDINSLNFFDKTYLKEASDLTKRIDAYIKDELDFSLDYETLLNENEDLIQTYAFALAMVGEITYDEYLEITTNKEGVLEYAKKLSAAEKLVVLTTKEQIVSSLFSYTLFNLFTNEKWACGGTFFIISMLICYSVIRRLVYNDIKLIGTKKALGFTTKEITLTYLGFSILSVLVGFILGAGTAVALESLFVPASLKKLYDVLFYVTYFEPLNTLILLIIVLGLICLITILSCRSILTKKGIALLNGDINVSKNKEGLVEKSKTFKKLPILNKVIFKNFKNDTNHVVATIIGISSAIALLMASLTLKISVNDSFAKQNKMFLYDTTINIDPRVDDGIENVEYYLDNNNYLYTPIKQEAITFSFGDNPISFGNIIVYFDNESFNNLIKLEESDNEVAFCNEGIWFPESYKMEYDLEDVTSVRITSNSGLDLNVNSTGFFKYYYFDGFVLVDYKTYKDITNQEITPNSLFVMRGNKDFNGLKKEIMKIEGCQSVIDNIGLNKNNAKVFDSVTTIVFILFLSATFMLSVFVILNLLSTQIQEKKREIITLIINGYSRKDAKKYIYFDTILLTIISLIVGVGVGIGLAAFTRSSLESETIYLMHEMNFLIIGISLLATIILVIIMSFISLRKIDKFKLKDIQK